MGSRSSSSFQKRQKELARIEKRKDKQARKEIRELEKDNAGDGPPIEPLDPADVGLPQETELGEAHDEVSQKF